MIIAIDGPASSGKSTTARLVAQKLGLMYLDTGAMYRAVALKIYRTGIELTEKSALMELLNNTEVEQVGRDDGVHILLDGEDVSEEIRTPDISLWVGPVSEHGLVRERLVAWQREIGKHGSIVADGRDIGTVVFPDAQVKIYLSADPHTRALRRQKELAARGIAQSVEEVESALVTRDQRDSSRAHSPLRKAEDAVEIDTTHLTVGDQVEKVLAIVKKQAAATAK
ncbi:MAG: (d)CMP kinase [Calditrichaeota bacterium]|nr:(d)CMP kinase [Calditrichota bacterium]MCB9366408.1 (d)CMP kinase [Calditrichota bacterium]